MRNDHIAPIRTHLFRDLTTPPSQSGTVSPEYAGNAAQRCSTSGLGLTQVTEGEVVTFHVNAGNAGVGELKVNITNPVNENIQVIISFYCISCYMMLLFQETIKIIYVFDEILIDI